MWGTIRPTADLLYLQMLRLDALLAGLLATLSYQSMKRGPKWTNISMSPSIMDGESHDLRIRSLDLPWNLKASISGARGK